jgi:hypothetical protein
MFKLGKDYSIFPMNCISYFSSLGRDYLKEKTELDCRLLIVAILMLINSWVSTRIMNLGGSLHLNSLLTRSIRVSLIARIYFPPMSRHL